MPPPSVSEVLSIPTRAGGITNGANSIADVLGQRQNQGLQLQVQQAQQLANAQAMSMAYTGRRNPNIDAMLMQNPFGKYVLPPNGGQPTGSGTPQVGNNIMSSTLMGVSPASAMFGAGGNIQPIGQGMPGAPTQPNQGGGGATDFSPLNPLNGPVPTGATSEFQPYIGMVPKSVSTENPAGKAQVTAATSYAGKTAEAQQAAQESESRDIQQLGMIKNAVKPLVESYDKVYNSKVGGILPAGGDIYGSTIAKNADWIPRGLQGSIVPPQTSEATGQFLSNKNELITKLQPLLSQQFGKEGSSRIMESLIKMSQQEIGDLNTPKNQFHGQISGTLGSLYRIAKASQAYKNDLAKSGQQMSQDPNQVAQEISSRMSTQTLSPKEQKEMQGMIDDVLGHKKDADFNPLSKTKSQNQSLNNGVPKYNPKTQKLQRNTRTGEYRVVSLNG